MRFCLWNRGNAGIPMLYKRALRGHCAGTVRALRGHCAGTARALGFWHLPTIRLPRPRPFFK
eukprot:11171239-Lingulodinium_polyedra.AAC.1